MEHYEQHYHTCFVMYLPLGMMQKYPPHYLMKFFLLTVCNNKVILLMNMRYKSKFFIHQQCIQSYLGQHRAMKMKNSTKWFKILYYEKHVQSIQHVQQLLADLQPDQMSVWHRYQRYEIMIKSIYFMIWWRKQSNTEKTVRLV